MARLHHFIFNCQAKLIKRHPFSPKWPYIVLTFSEDRGDVSLHYSTVPIPPLVRQLVIWEMNIIKNYKVCWVVPPIKKKEKKIEVLPIWSLQSASQAVDLHTVPQCSCFWAGVPSLFHINCVSDRFQSKHFQKITSFTFRAVFIQDFDKMSLKPRNNGLLCTSFDKDVESWNSVQSANGNNNNNREVSGSRRWSKTNVGKPCMRQWKTNQQHSHVSDLAARWVRSKTY